MPLTQLLPGVLSGRRDGSFAGKATELHPVGVLTALGGGALSGRRVKAFAFAGKVPHVPTPPLPDLPRGGDWKPERKRPARRRRRRKDEEDLIVILC
jgi:hypothetical protein